MGAGASVKKPLPVEVKTWVNVNDSDFVYPELREAYADASGPSIKKMLEEKDDLVRFFIAINMCVVLILPSRD